MAGHDSCRIALCSRAGAIALTALVSACASIGDPAGFGIAAQDKYDFMACPQIVGARAGLVGREKELADLAAKAEESPGGIIVSYSAYRSELTQTRALLAAADRALLKNGCDPSKKP